MLAGAAWMVRHNTTYSMGVDQGVVKLENVRSRFGVYGAFTLHARWRSVHGQRYRRLQ